MRARTSMDRNLRGRVSTSGPAHSYFFFFYPSLPSISFEITCFERSKYGYDIDIDGLQNVHRYAKRTRETSGVQPQQTSSSSLPAHEAEIRRKYVKHTKSARFGMSMARVRSMINLAAFTIFHRFFSPQRVKLYRTVMSVANIRVPAEELCNCHLRYMNLILLSLRMAMAEGHGICS